MQRLSSTSPGNSADSGARNVRALLAAAAARLGILGAMRGAAMAVLLMTLWVARGLLMASAASNAWSLTRMAGVAIAMAGAGAALGWWRARPDPRRAAHELEGRLPQSRNLLVTAQELLADTDASARPEVVSVTPLVLQRAGAFAESIEIAQILPRRRRALELAGSVALLATMFLLVHGAGPTAVQPVSALVSAVTGRVDISRITVRITSPAYTRQAPEVLRDPTRIDALAGSLVTLTMDASADTIMVTTRDSTQSLARSADGTFSFAMRASADGFIGVVPRAAGGRAGPRRLIGVSVRSDEAPRVRIVAPARDLIVPDAKRTLDIGIEADDDLALGSLRLRYTKVSGSGERFTFSEGEVPVSIVRARPVEWTARAALALAPLLQEPGDLVVYRAVATDSRPGSPAIESDAFIAELAAPGGVAALGFSLDPDEDRYALSQQMVILKTERLLAQRGSLAPATLAEQAMLLAGEQRRVRAEFVFMMGGEFAQQVTGEDGMTELDEHEEAESEGDLAAGRMVNRGRTALLSAVRAMSRAAVALTTAELTPALAQEKFALTQLQEAFARNRFLMRALSQREQLDMTRRLTGRLDSIARGSARIPEGRSEARQLALRALLGELTAARAARVSESRGDLRDELRGESPFVAIAQRLLQTDPSSRATQRIAALLTDAGAAAAPQAARVLLDSAAVGLTALLRDGLRPAASAPMSADARRLHAGLEAALGRSPQPGTPAATGPIRRRERP